MRHIPLFPPHDAAAAARFIKQLATQKSLDIPQFWHDMESIDVPLVTEVQGSQDERDVTFLWRASDSLQGVYVFLNRVTDKINVPMGMMTRVPSSDIWTLTLRLPATYRGTYTFTEIPLGTSPEVVAMLGGRFTPFVGQSDPLNKTGKINVRGIAEESILALDKAPAQPEWAGAPLTPRGEGVTFNPVVAGHQRRVRLYLPDVADTTPLGLLVLLDAEKWFDHVGILGALDVALTNGRIGPTAVLGIDNLDEVDRAAILGGQSELVLDIAEKLVPQVMADYPDKIWAGRSKTVLCGQSLGGVTALMAAMHAPDVFGTVLSHSPSMWWMPQKRKRDPGFSENDTSWVSEHLLSTPPQEVHVRLCVGSLEGFTVTHLEQLHQRLLAAGVDSHLAVYTGGHDFAWWRGAIIDGLAALSHH
ncbi:alpha/beta hydrolase-fold protein [Rouxiella chamberiensis]|uniref:alpha/beta hydrolase-fold protein n=1 Tax=Rouxiella chamberiensis TaxID=1513468 RepID=UPI0005D39B25|nr:alpha/beta hydrolase-fold protein [Rouxiella chamberiensis]